VTGATTQRLLRIAGVGMVALGGASHSQDVSVIAAQSGLSYALIGSATSQPTRYEVQSNVESILPTLERLQELSKLEPNWDSYDAEPLSPTAVATASTLIAAVDETRRAVTGKHAPPWMVAPVPDGGLQVEWKSGPRKIEVLIDPEGDLSYLIIDRSAAIPAYTEQHGVSLGQIRALVDAVLAV
jgi:hypothetical protein